MPRYDYSCRSCGVFRDWTAMSRCSAPARCPSCGTLSARVLFAPFLADMNRQDRIAHQRNELSANEPRVMTREQLDLGSARHVHGHHAAAGEGDRGSRPHPHDHGRGRHRRAGRPWMIGH